MQNLNNLASKHSAQKGFTLLELILVVFIMGTLAATSMSFIENEDGQWRYQQSLDKLDMVHAALVGVQDYNQQKLLSGFVYDNGVLPPNEVQPLGSPGNPTPALVTLGLEAMIGNNLTGAGAWQAYGSTAPIYHYKEGTDVQNYELADAADALFKGYRPGGYLKNFLDAENKLKNGWGADFNVTVDSDYSTELGDAPAPFNTGYKKITYADDWSMVLSELNGIRVSNTTALTAAAAPHYLVLLVFENATSDDANARWRSYSSKCINEGVASLPLGIPAGTTTSCSFDTITTFDTEITEITDSAALTAQRVPVGTHLLAVLKQDTSATPTAVSVETVQTITLYPRTQIPTLNLTFDPDP